MGLMVPLLSHLEIAKRGTEIAHGSHLECFEHPAHKQLGF